MHVQIERLKKDQKEAVYYQKKLKRKGKEVLAYKMQKKIEFLNRHIEDMNMATVEGR
tara:strand:+ start:5428 stop:5598 length:171 start_codon:yes stop_codon:yes gene_type:complete